jgi:hypothetical protein
MIAFRLLVLKPAYTSSFVLSVRIAVIYISDDDNDNNSEPSTEYDSNGDIDVNVDDIHSNSASGNDFIYDDARDHDTGRDERRNNLAKYKGDIDDNSYIVLTIFDDNVSVRG